MIKANDLDVSKRFNDFKNGILNCTSRDLSPLNHLNKGIGIQPSDKDRLLDLFKESVEGLSPQSRLVGLEQISLKLKEIYPVSANDVQHMSFHRAVANLIKPYIQTVDKKPIETKENLAKTSSGISKVSKYCCKVVSYLDQIEQLYKDNAEFIVKSESGKNLIGMFFSETEIFNPEELANSNSTIASLKLKLLDIGRFAFSQPKKMEEFLHYIGVDEELAKNLFEFGFSRIFQTVASLEHHIKNKSPAEEKMLRFVAFWMKLELLKKLYEVSVYQTARSTDRNSIFNSQIRQFFDANPEALKKPLPVMNQCRALFAQYAGSSNSQSTNSRRNSESEVDRFYSKTVEARKLAMSGDPLPLEEMTIYKPMPAQLQKSKQTKTKASSSQSSRPEPEFKESGVARKQRLSLKPKGNASAKESSETSELLYREVDERVQRWIDQSGEKSDFSVVKSFKKEYENMSKGQLDGLVRRHAFSQILDSHIHLFDKQPLPRGEGVFYSTLGKLTMMGRSQLVRAEYVIDSKGSLIHRYLKCIDNRSDLFQTVQQQISEIEFPPLVRSLEKPQKKIVESDLESSVEFDPNFNILNLTDLSNDLKLELFLPELDS